MPAEENIVCVKCTSVLDRTTIGGVEVDICPQCGGIWLDRGELEKLGAKDNSELDTLRSALGVDETKAPPIPSDHTSPCPVCEGSLHEHQLGNIQVDICDSCRGIWLDKGEFDQALAVIKEKGLPVELIISLANSVDD